MTIPKTIHYCWFSNDEKPEKIQKCIESWSQHMPDYVIKLWDANSFDFDSVPFVKDAYKRKKWAFVSDFIRIYALYTEGGIYLDSDVLVFKSFDDLLKNKVFIATEMPLDGIFKPEPAIMGAIKGHSLFGNIIHYYTNLKEQATEDVMKRLCDFSIIDVNKYYRNIYNDNHELQLVVAPDVFVYYLKEYGYNFSQGQRQLLHDGITMYPQPLFTNSLELSTEATYAVHLYAHSWISTLYSPSDNRGIVFKLCKKYNLHKTYRTWCRFVEYIRG